MMESDPISQHHQSRHHRATISGNIKSNETLPLVISLNCLEDCNLEQESLSEIATIQHIDLAHISDGRIEVAAVVLLHSLAFLPRAAQRRLQPWQLILCLGSTDRAVDSTLASDLGLNVVHVDVSRSEEIADTIMALFLGLLRRTHLLSKHAFSASGWLGSLQPLCRGMRRCRGLVLGIIGRSASARSLALRSLAFRMSVLYFDVYDGKGKSGQSSNFFPRAARRMDTINDLLAASDLISLHCALTSETVHIINEECLQHIKPGAFIVNTRSSQLLDDCAVKQLLIDGTIAGCALDGAEGPQWMEAWVREMPNVLILPRSADYSEEVWMEIREKAVSILHTYFVDGVVPKDAVSDEDEESGIGYGDDQSVKPEKECASQGFDGEQMIEDSNINCKYLPKEEVQPLKEQKVQSENSSLSQTSSVKSETRRSRSGKKGKKRPAWRKSNQPSDGISTLEIDCIPTSQREDDSANIGRDSALSSSSHFASSEDSRNKKSYTIELNFETISGKDEVSSNRFGRNCGELLKDGHVIALHSRDRPGYHVSRQRVPGGGWFLDLMSCVDKSDPAAQFIVASRSKDNFGLRSFAAGGKLLQINRRMEFIFASHSFDVWENWMLEGSILEECRLVNCRNPSAVLDVRIQILAAVGDDGVARWIH